MSKSALFAALATVLTLSGLVLFHCCAGWLAQSNYVGAALLALSGLAVVHFATYFARLALVDRR